MSTFYVGSSKRLAKWGSDHGLTKYLYKVGVTGEDPAAAIERFNAEQHAGQNDWKLAKKVENVDAEEARILPASPPTRSWSILTTILESAVHRASSR